MLAQDDQKCTTQPASQEPSGTPDTHGEGESKGPVSKSADQTESDLEQSVLEMLLKDSSLIAEHSARQPIDHHMPEPTEEHKPTRRAFLQSVMLDTATIGATLPLVPEISLFPSSTEESTEPDDGKYRFTNQQVSFDDTTSFTNIGVRHTSLDLLRDHRVLFRAIREHDVVMVEGFAGQDYFDFLAVTAYQENKKLVRLESDIPLAANVLPGFVPLISFAMVCINGLHYFERGLSALGRIIHNRFFAATTHAVEGSQAKQTTSQPPPKPTYRRAALTLLACQVQEIFWIAPQQFDARYNYPLEDTGHLLDGRTVIMLDEVRSYLKSHPGEKVLVITGDAHARGFCLYTSTAELRERFEQKLAHYNRIYKPILKGNAKEEFDISVDPTSGKAGTESSGSELP